MGQEAVFFGEFVLAVDVQAPVVGVEILNERNIVIHGKNSLQHALEVPPALPRGTTLRFRQRIRLGVAPGSYTFNIGLAALPESVYRHASDVAYERIAAELRVLLVVLGAGSFSVVPRRRGQALPYHGLSDLDGDSSLQVVSHAAAAELDHARSMR
jgi:hypothetical protein